MAAIERRPGVNDWRGTCILALALMVAAPAAAVDHIKNLRSGDASYQGRLAAEFHEAGRLRSAAVVPFAGADGGNFSRALASALGGVKLNGEPWFTVQTGEGADPLAAAKALGAKAVYSGVVANARLTRTDRSEAAANCDTSGKCKPTGGPPVTCTRVTIDYQVNAKVSEVATARAVYNKAHTANAGYDICNGKKQVVAVIEDKGAAVRAAEWLTGKKKVDDCAVACTDDGLFEKARAAVAAAIVNDVAPFNETVEVEFKRRASELPKANQATFESAVPFIKARRLERACSIWELLSSEPAAATSISLLYNLGVCQEVQVPENPAAALEYYVKADQLTIKPDKDVSEAVLRAQMMVRNQQKIGS
jgi:hypothetical protein